MSTTIKAWYDFVLQQMAAESYLNDWNTLSPDVQKVRLNLGSNNYLNPDNQPNTPILDGATRMTATQAADFTSRYTVVSHLPNTASGFSATLMLDNNTGAYTLSIRSTEYFNEGQGGDWLRDGLPGADGEIGRTGFAFGQIASMESYYEHLKLGEKYDAMAGAWVYDPALDGFSAAFGGANPTGGTLNVTGYSLSGQMADVFKQLHPEVAQACVFNATGMGNIGSGNLQTMVTDLRQQLAAAGIDLSVPSLANIYDLNPMDPEANTPYQTIVNGIEDTYGTSYSISGNAVSLSNTVQLYGHGANNDDQFVANAGNHAPATKIFIEDQPDIQGLIFFTDPITGTPADFYTTHSITLLADSLAVMSVFEKLGLDMSTSQGLSSAYSILAASSSREAVGKLGSSGTAEGDSLEKAVEALGRIFLGEGGVARVLRDSPLNTNGSTEIPYGTSGGDFSNLSNRSLFYDVLNAVSAAIGNASYTVRDLTAFTADQIASVAQNNIAYRYALINANPFAILGNEQIYDQFNSAGELDLYNPATGEGSLTQEYLADRAAMLVSKIRAGLDDSNLLVTGLNQDASLARLPGEETLYRSFVADANGQIASSTIYQGQNYHVGLPPGPEVRQTNSDALDMRQIQFGSNLGDTLTGGNKDDRLYGGAGDDILNGGAGSDTLVGGKGFDTYFADGGDTIIDGEGAGRIYVGGVLLTGGTWDDDAGAYVSDDGTIAYHESSDGSVVVYTPDGTVRIQSPKGGVGVNNRGDSSPPLPVKDLEDKFGLAMVTKSPLVLDLNGDGIATSGVTAGVYFDHDANGFAELTGWVNGQDGILVRDLDGNGAIDNGRELFGSETLLANGQKASNGYVALAELDSNLDGKIDQQDAAYSTLRVWKDANSDGHSSADELFTLGNL